MEITAHIFMHSPSTDNAFRAQLAQISHQLNHVERHIMATIEEFATAQQAHNDRMTAALAGVAGDIDAMKATIAELQAAAGTLTPAQQAKLDELTAQGEALSGSVEAIDALTPPPVPPTV